MPFNLNLVDIGYAWGNDLLFSGVNLGVGSGNILILTGRSGSGKSTVLEIAAGLRKPSKGSVRWNGRDISTFSRAELRARRQHMGYVFQPHALISNFTVADNVALPLRYHSRLDESKIKSRIESHLELFGIAAIARKRPEELSVGQARLASIARAFVMNPDVVFLDEPLSGLDPQTARVITDILRRMAAYHDVTLVVVSHEADFIRGMDCAVAFLENGSFSMHSSVELDGSPTRISKLATYFSAGIDRHPQQSDIS